LPAYIGTAITFEVLQLYKFLARRTESDFNARVLKRLMMSKTNRPPMGLARVLRYAQPKAGAATKAVLVVVGTVTDDVRLTGHEMPAIKLCALRVTEGARARIEKAGGEVMTFDQLALMAPKGEDTLLLRGRKTAREAQKHFGTPGSSENKSKPFTRSKGRKFEKARGRRSSRGFKVKSAK
jgi:large subunit ribosomal protein L18e